MPIIGITASSNQTIKLSNFYSIATTTVGAGGSASVVFSNIPQTYTHLQIRGIARSTQVQASANTIMRFNSDSANNYGNHFLTGNGTSVSGGNEVSASSTFIYTGALIASSSLANSFEVSTIDILDYTNTNKFKTVRSLAGWNANGTGFVALWSGHWRSTSAITTITLLPNIGSFTQYTTFALYGVLN